MDSHDRLTRRSEFTAVQASNLRWANGLLSLRGLPNQREKTRIGLLVSKRVGTAVIRNRAKRRLREILRMEPVPLGWDMVFSARPGVAQAGFAELQHAVRELVRRVRLPAPRAAAGPAAGSAPTAGTAR
ncbi:MAG: ribonuclease P protein component [Dehalococcoidia bacterium]|nr:ribonuclease P protein component [Dehalococcoidia bacterium]